MDATAEPVLRLAATGHPAVRATHAKTLELAVDPDITERATCVLGVGLRGTARALAGPVRVTITAGPERVTLSAVANPGWDASGAAVLRRGTDRRHDTFATESTTVAADLPRGLVDRLADPATVVDVWVDRLPRRPDGRSGLVLLFAAPDAVPVDRLAAERAAADVVVVADRAAADLLGETDRRAPVAEAVSGLLDDTVGRVLVVATSAVPRAGLRAALERPDRVAVEVAGLPWPLAAAAASPRRAPLRMADARAAVLDDTASGDALALVVAAAEFPRLLARAGARETGVLLDPAAGGAAAWGPLAGLRPSRTGGEVVCVLDPAPSADTGLDGALGEFAAALLADGVSARSVALALARLPGWSRRRAYDAVQALRDDDQP